MEQTTQEQGMNPILKAVLGITGLLILIVAGWFAYTRFMPAAGSSSITPANSNGTKKDANEDIFGSSDTASGNNLSSGDRQVVKDNTTALGTVAGIGFPLKKVSGAELHKTNTFVKNVQQYLNKYKGATLDIDGAFGSETEAAVMKTFGTKTVSKEQYNTVVAPSLGVSLVV